MTTDTADSSALLSRYRDAIEPALRAALDGNNSPLATAGRYVMGWETADGQPANFPGKRIRPALCLLAAELFSGTIEAAMPGAVAVELVHNFSLVHDEVQDHDAERHHRPTIWALMGEGQAINVGDYLYTCAVGALVHGPGDAERRMQALGVLNEAIGQMIGGQWQDISFERRLDVLPEEYLAMVAGKTGALLGAPLEMGALLAGASAEDARVMGRWGRQVGLAFQAHDDYLGIWGDPAQTGKSNSNDIARRKKTLPVVIGMGHAASRDTIAAAYTSEAESLGEDDIAAVVTALAEAGVDDKVREQARQYAAEADALLDSLSLGEERRAQLREIAVFLVERAG